LMKKSEMFIGRGAKRWLGGPLFARPKCGRLCGGSGLGG
jgi:hypothetical protein